MGSILNDTKKILGVPQTDDSFDLDIITHINSVFADLQMLGVGPSRGFMIENESDDWDDYIRNDNSYNNIRSYMFLKVKMLFDPPPTSYHITAMNEQIEKKEWLISTNREWKLDPVDPKNP